MGRGLSSACNRDYWARLGPFKTSDPGLSEFSNKKWQGKRSYIFHPRFTLVHPSIHPSDSNPRRSRGGRRSEAQQPSRPPLPLHSRPFFPWRSRCAAPRPPPPRGAPSFRRLPRPLRGGFRGGRPQAAGATVTTATAADSARATTTSPSSSARRTSRMGVSALSYPILDTAFTPTVARCRVCVFSIST